MSQTSRWIVTLMFLTAPFYAHCEQEMDIELLEFIGMWESGSGDITPEPNSHNTENQWLDPFAIPELEHTNQPFETTEPL